MTIKQLEKEIHLTMIRAMETSDPEREEALWKIMKKLENELKELVNE